MASRRILDALAALLIPALLAAAPVAAQPRAGDDEPTTLEVPGGDIFGFTSPTDVGNPGDRAIAFETSTRASKRGGTYLSPTLKTQLSVTPWENLAVAVSPFVTGHRIRSVPNLDDRSQLRFDGLSAEASYRILSRTATNPLAATLSVEPRWARIDAVTGERASAYGAEFKLFLDTVLVPGRLYGAINLNYVLGTQRSDVVPDAPWAEASGTNVSGALTYQLTDRLFVGIEARYLAVFSGAFLNDLAGQALLAGPNLLVKLSESTALNVAWTPQITGRSEAMVDRRLDLDNFERQQLRLKLATSF